MNLVTVLTGAHVALRVLQARLLTLIALLLTFFVYAWAMWQQTILGAIIAGGWGLTIFLPVLLTGRGGFDGVSQGQSEPDADGSAGGQSAPS